MLQQWRDLSFLHFPAPPEEIQALLPPGLTVDVFPDGEGPPCAWVGLVPFRMQRVTPARLPPIPGCHAFPETNVRTYVHRDGKQPGVWFFSLDASNAFACRFARVRYRLPYYHARMKVRRQGENVRYESRRRNRLAAVSLHATVGESLTVEPGSLEFFLVERYLLYAERNGKLFTGRVHHDPYSIRSLDVHSLEQSIVQAAGIPARRFTHSLFSDGVDVEVFPLMPA